MHTRKFASDLQSRDRPPVRLHQSDTNVKYMSPNQQRRRISLEEQYDTREEGAMKKKKKKKRDQQYKQQIFLWPHTTFSP